MKFLLIFVLIFVFIFLIINPYTQTILFNPFKTLFFGITDLFKYFRYKKFNISPCGHIIAYTGLFGKGKTLSCTHTVIKLFNRYNDKRFYDENTKHWVTQKVMIISNVHLLKVPYVPFDSLGQLLNIACSAHTNDAEQHLHTVIYVIGDEFSVMLNSRSFKDNFNALSLAMLLQSRKYNMSIFFTAQRFNQCDALLRQVTEYVFECCKVWRLQVNVKYNAYELENCSNPLLVRPLGKIPWFVLDKDYNAYNTMQLADTIKTKCDNNDMLTDMEIINLQSNNTTDSVIHPSKRYKSRKR